MDLTAWVGGLVPGVGEQELRDAFSSCGEVVSVQVVQEGQTGDCYGLVTFQTTEGLQNAEQGEVVVGGVRLSVARVWTSQWSGLPEQHITPMFANNMLAYNVQSQPPPLYLQQPGVTPISYFPYQPAAAPETDFASLNSPTPGQSPTTSPAEGACHVCSNQQPTFPLTTSQYPPPQTPLYYGPASHQLQPLTPIMTPAPSPTFMMSSSLPTFFPHTTYPMPPTPGPLPYQAYPPPHAPSYCIPPGGFPSDGASAQVFQPPVPQPQFQVPPPSQRSKRLAFPDSVGEGAREPANANVSYFTSPFKRFSKFNGTPSPTRARIPLQRPPQQGKGGSRGTKKESKGDNSSWYKAGARWGQKDGVVEEEVLNKGLEPDLVKDLESCSIQEA
jgi:RNA recognition motif-containing protein